MYARLPLSRPFLCFYAQLLPHALETLQHMRRQVASACAVCVPAPCSVRTADVEIPAPVWATMCDAARIHAARVLTYSHHIQHAQFHASHVRSSVK